MWCNRAVVLSVFAERGFQAQPSTQGPAGGEQRSVQPVLRSDDARTVFRAGELPSG